MFLFFAFTESINISDVAFCSWSGAGCIKNRILPNSRTWYQLLPEVTIYAEDFRPGEAEECVKQNNHLNIHFRKLDLQTFALMGSEFDTAWNHAQARHLVSMHDFVERNPGKEWYVFFDDDTYFFMDNLMDFLETHDPNKDAMYGVTYGVASFSTPFFKNIYKFHDFVHGGSGIIISKSFIQRVKDKFLPCSDIFNLANVGSDIRFALCLERYFDDGPRGYSSYLQSDPERFWPDVPEELEDRRSQFHPQISAHHIDHDRAYKFYNLTTSRWTLPNGTDVYADWSIYAAIPYQVEIAGGGMFNFYFGYKMCRTDLNHARSSATTMITPKTNNDNPTEYYQTYERGFNVRYICDDNLEKGEIAQDSSEQTRDAPLTLRVRCPKVRQFINNHPGKESPFDLSVVPVNML